MSLEPTLALDGDSIYDHRFIDSPFRSVDTPVENRPREATANEPPRSTFTQVSN
jgi:hypothetical protein